MFRIFALTLVVVGLGSMNASAQFAPTYVRPGPGYAPLPAINPYAVSPYAVNPVPPAVSPYAVNPYAVQPGVSPFAVNPYAVQPGVNPYAVNPYAMQPGVNPYAANPYAMQPSVNPYAANPYAVQPSANPYAVNPYAVQPGVNPYAVNPYAVAPNPYGFSPVPSTGFAVNNSGARYSVNLGKFSFSTFSNNYSVSPVGGAPMPGYMVGAPSYSPAPSLATPAAPSGPAVLDLSGIDLDSRR